MERRSHSFHLTRPGILTLDRLWNGFDSDAKLFMYQNKCINYYFEQFDKNEYFSPLQFSSVGIKIGVLKVWVSPNSNWVRFMKSLASEPGLRVLRC